MSLDIAEQRYFKHFNISFGDEDDEWSIKTPRDCIILIYENTLFKNYPDSLDFVYDFSKLPPPIGYAILHCLDGEFRLTEIRGNDLTLDHFKTISDYILYLIDRFNITYEQHMFNAVVKAYNVHFPKCVKDQYFKMLLESGLLVSNSFIRNITTEDLVNGSFMLAPDCQDIYDQKDVPVTQKQISNNLFKTPLPDNIQPSVKKFETFQKYVDKPINNTTGFSNKFTYNKPSISPTNNFTMNNTATMPKTGFTSSFTANKPTMTTMPTKMNTFSSFSNKLPTSPMNTFAANKTTSPMNTFTANKPTSPTKMNTFTANKPTSPTKMNTFTANKLTSPTKVNTFSRFSNKTISQQPTKTNFKSFSSMNNFKATSSFSQSGAHSPKIINAKDYLQNKYSKVFTQLSVTETAIIELYNDEMKLACICNAICLEAKKKFCNEKGIHMIYIPYNVNIIDIPTYIEKELQKL